jgi:N-acetylglucosamine-6-phosphate deacetylase
METAFINGLMLTRDGWVGNQALLLSGDRISALVAADDRRLNGAVRMELGGRLLLPGFIDTQVNGGGGVLFNDDPSVAGIRRIASAHARFGTTGLLPTLISDEPTVIARAIAAVDAAMAAQVPGILGIHIEGPYLNAARKGIHDGARLAKLDDQAIDLLCSLRRGLTLVTLAPELASNEQLDRLARAGVIICAGHTNAGFDDIMRAREHGLRGFTHLFNAMSPLTAREPGVVGAALIDDDTWCGIIADGKHVDPRSLRVALRAKSHTRFMLVTDAMPTVGTQLRSFDLHGKRIHVVDGYCIDDAGVLAGTAIDMNRTLRNAIAMLGLPAATAVRMASQYPAEFLGLGASHGALAAGMRADLVIADEHYEVQETWIGGQRYHSSEAGGSR